MLALVTLDVHFPSMFDNAVLSPVLKKWIGWHGFLADWTGEHHSSPDWNFAHNNLASFSVRVSTVCPSTRCTAKTISRWYSQWINDIVKSDGLFACFMCNGICDIIVTPVQPSGDTRLEAIGDLPWLWLQWWSCRFSQQTFAGVTFAGPVVRGCLRRHRLTFLHL